jgi:hypothetical protein
MAQLTRQLISVALTAMLAATAAYGSWLPMRKLALFLHAQDSLPTIHTAAEYMALLSAALDAPSPIGQEELVRWSAQTVTDLIQTGRTKPQSTVQFVEFLNHYFLPIVQRRTGNSFALTAHVAGTLQMEAYFRMGDPAYLTDAGTLFLTGLEASPRRAEFLYGLFDVYRLAADTGRVKAIADQILTQWPDDQLTRASLAEYLAQPR